MWWARRFANNESIPRVLVIPLHMIVRGELAECSVHVDLIEEDDQVEAFLLLN